MFMSGLAIVGEILLILRIILFLVFTFVANTFLSSWITS